MKHKLLKALGGVAGIIAIALGLSGCGTLKNLSFGTQAQGIGSAIALLDDYDALRDELATKGKNECSKDGGIFSKDECVKLGRALRSADTLVATVRGISKGEGVQKLEAVATIFGAFRKARNDYIVARSIIKAHADEISSNVWMDLIDLDTRATIAAGAMDELMAGDKDSVSLAGIAETVGQFASLIIRFKTGAL